LGGGPYIVRLGDDVATVPFIARYRKEVTGAVDDAHCAPSMNACGICWSNGTP